MEGGTTTTYDYTLHGKLITHLTKTVNGTKSDEMHFFYDAQGKPAMVKHGNNLYCYVHNLQGDIVGIIDGAGTLVVEYKYDAWGEPLSIAGTLKTTLGELNPFRYRGYVLDMEIELYYLRNRYYSPLFGRFINCDRLFYAYYSLNGTNIFTYCKNAPIIAKDSDGLEPYIIIAAYTPEHLRLMTGDIPKLALCTPKMILRYIHMDVMQTMQNRMISSEEGYLSFMKAMNRGNQTLEVQTGKAL